MTDPYQPPASDVRLPSAEGIGKIEVFQRFSSWYVLGLSIITLNLYAPYWLFTRSMKLNQIVENQISMFFCQFTTVLICCSYFTFLLRELSYFEHPYFELGTLILDQVANIMLIVWVYKFRNRLANTFTREQVHLGIVVPLLFLHIYLQYKLNELLDASISSGRIQPDPARSIE